MTKIDDKLIKVDTDKINDRTVITYKKSKIVGLASATDVMNGVLIAARMQAEKYIEKLLKGDTLTDKEVTSLAQLAALTKINVQVESKEGQLQQLPVTDIEVLKSNIYARLTDRKD